MARVVAALADFEKGATSDRAVDEASRRDPTRQPFEGAVRTHVNERIDLGNVPKPAWV